MKILNILLFFCNIQQMGSPAAAEESENLCQAGRDKDYMQR